MAICILFVAVLLQGISAFGQSPEKPKALSEKTSLPYWNDGGTAIDTLVDVAVLNAIPVGIVIEGENLCKYRIDGRPDDTVEQLMDSLERNIPGYTAKIKNGVLLVEPEKVTSGTQRSLDVVIPRFGAEQPESMEKLSIDLWFFIRAVLVPDRSSAFSGGLQKDGEALSAFQLSNVTVEEILDYLVTKKAGGLWAISKVPDGWMANPSIIPYKVVSYSGNSALAAKLKCGAP